MHPNAITSVVEKLTGVAENMIYPLGFSCAGASIVGGTVETNTFTFTDEGAQLNGEVLRELLTKYGWSDKFSERFLLDRIFAIFHKVLQTHTTNDVRPEFENLVAEYEGYAVEWTVIVPLAGLIMDMEEFTLGEVVLRSMRGDTVAQLTERCRSITMRTPDSTTEQRHEHFAMLDANYLAKIRNRVCAEVKIVAEPNRAEELALDRTRRVIDLLRFTILFLDHGMGKKVIGLQGEACEDIRAMVSIRSDDSGAHYNQSVVFLPFHLTEQVVERMREIGVFVLSVLLQKEIPTDFEKVILRAVHWLSNAQAQYENGNALLNLVTCLETFLKPDKADPIMATIAEGVAILTASGLENRKRQKEKIKEFYGKRSKLTHEGRGKILDSELRELTNIARDLTIQMIQRKDEFPTHEALRNWIDDQKLGGGTALC